MSSIDGDERDPFACFGDDDDSVDTEHSNQSERNAATDAARHPIRDPSCGVLAFHAGTEKSLLKHVKLELTERSIHSSSNGRHLSTSEMADMVLRLVDEYCLSRHWMMHVGKEKGVIIQDFLEECCQRYLHDKTRTSGRPFIVVELGTYCGYSSILLAKTLYEIGCPFHLFSVEVERNNVDVAIELIQLASIDRYISVLLLNSEVETLSDVLKRGIQAQFPNLSCDDGSSIDFLFIDHDKTLYLSDLLQLEKSGFIRSGCFVAADNVLFARIDDYRRHMSELSLKNIVHTELKEAPLEYCEPDCDISNSKAFSDGIGKLSHRVPLPIVCS